jgi:hypothetical protein
MCAIKSERPAPRHQYELRLCQRCADIRVSEVGPEVIALHSPLTDEDHPENCDIR